MKFIWVGGGYRTRVCVGGKGVYRKFLLGEESPAPHPPGTTITFQLDKFCILLNFKLILEVSGVGGWRFSTFLPFSEISVFQESDYADTHGNTSCGSMLNFVVPNYQCFCWYA